MSGEYTSELAPFLPRTLPVGFATWNEYWAKSHDQPWRTEPEIDAERQQYLAERRSIEPDPQRGIFPYTDIKLVRADVEWLLATHESDGIRGPVDWSDDRQRKRPGLDLRGADLRQANLVNLPLARLRCGYDLDLVSRPGTAQPDLELPELYNMPDGMVFGLAHLENADLRGCHLEGSSFGGAHLSGANLDGAYLESAYLTGVNIFGPSLNFALGEYTATSLNRAHLQNACLQSSNLQGAAAVGAHFEGADLRLAHLRGTFLAGAHLEDADLRNASFGESTLLNGATLGSERDGVARLADVQWSGANLTLVRWATFRRGALIAKQGSRSERILTYNRAVRANRQLATVLRSQGLNDQADRFAYQAQILQQRVYWHGGKGLHYVGSLFLDLVSGYGYKPMRSLIAYIIIILAFAGAYLLNAQFAAPHLTWDEALVLSISAFHGRGFFTSGISLGDTLARLAAGEAIIGLLIEIIFIATFTQRFFAR